jgi:acetyl/propionyl-CoA carboxylase alpha subunit
MERTFRQGEDLVHAALRRDGDALTLVTAGGTQRFEWQGLEPGEYLLRENGRQWRCLVARAGDERWVWIEGRVFRLQVASAARKRSAADSGALAAPMPGQVLEVRVAPGDSVRKDQVLVVLEAMKMQYEIVAPRDGIVATVQASPGTQVAGGLALVTLAEEA